MEIEAGEPGDFGMVCKMRKKGRRKRQKLIIIDLFLDFAKNTTLHGLRYITEVGLTLVEKIFWILTFLLSLGLCLYLIEKVRVKWWYSPVIVSFNERMIPVSDIPFPSVTICPQWKCDKTFYNYRSEYERIWKSVENNETVGERDKQLLEDAMLVCDTNYQHTMETGKTSLLERNTSNRSLIDQLHWIAPLFFDIFIPKCSWRGKSDWCENMFSTVYTNEGICFNFNALAYEDMFQVDRIQKDYKYLSSRKINRISNWDFKSGYNSSQEDSVYPYRGQENGATPDLEFVLFENSVNNDERCNSLSDGFKIYVQHPADMPQSSLYYYATLPGQVTSLALMFNILNTSDNLKDYTPNQRQCYYPDDFPLEYFKIYTPSNCRLECLSLYTYRKCGCVWFHMPHKSGSQLCTLKKRECVRNASAEIAAAPFKTLEYGMSNKCNCLPSCVSVQYDAEVLKTHFNFKKDYELRRNWYNESVDMGYFLDGYNISKVELYFKEPRCLSMLRTELFGLSDFLAYCGGLLGLFLGFSFLSIVEIVYFCTLRLWCTLKKDIKIEKKKFKESMRKY